jgi:hypothetical protein
VLGEGRPATYFFFAALGLLDEQEAFAPFALFLDMQGIAVTSLVDSPPPLGLLLSGGPFASASAGRRPAGCRGRTGDWARGQHPAHGHFV